MVNKVVCDPLLPLFQQRQERTEAIQAAALDPLPPETQTPQPILFRARCVKDSGQLPAQVVGFFRCWAARERLVKSSLLGFSQICGALPERPRVLFQVVLLLLGRFL